MTMSAGGVGGQDPFNAAAADASIDHRLLDEHQDGSSFPDELPAPKRKGGRKPIYSNAEQRKQRNRQAQAEFRQRRTEYIKQMEAAMKENEDMLETLRQEHREMTDQCHMLRYKTSLLEELLDERGIDFRTELQARSSRSMLGQPRAAPAPGSRADQSPLNKRRSTTTAPSRAGFSVKASNHGSGRPSAVRHPVESPQSSAPSPSSFTFANMSADAQDFDPAHSNGVEPVQPQRVVDGDLFDHVTNRAHLSSGLANALANAQHLGPQHPYGQNAAYANDDSYEYSQEALRSAQSRAAPNRLGK